MVVRTYAFSTVSQYFGAETKTSETPGFDITAVDVVVCEYD